MLTPAELKQLFTVWLFFVVNPTLFGQIQALSTPDFNALAARIGLQPNVLGAYVRYASSHDQICANQGGTVFHAVSAMFADFAVNGAPYTPIGGKVCGTLDEVLGALYPLPAAPAV